MKVCSRCQLYQNLTQYFPQAASSAEESEDESVSSLQRQRKTSVTKLPTGATRKLSDAGTKKTRSPSSDSSTSSESSAASSSALRSTGAPFTTDEVKQKIFSRSDNTTPRTPLSTSYRESPTQKQSKYTPPVKPTLKTSSSITNDEETETTSEEEETDSEEQSEEEETKADMAKTDIGPLLARSANARDNSSDSTRRASRDDTSSYTRSRYTPKEESRYTKKEEDETPKYGYTSRFLNKSRSSAAIPDDDDSHTSSRYTTPTDDDNKYTSGRSRYMALKDRRQRLARSKSSQQFGEDDDPEEPLSPTTTNPSAYLAARGYGSTTPGQDLARSRSSHALKSRDPSPERPTSTTEKDGAALSSWARYLKNKYGNRNTAKEKDSGSTTSPSGTSSSAAARRLSLGLPLRSSTELASSDDDSKNMQGSPTTPTAATQATGKR